MPAGVGKRILSVHVVIDVMSKDGLRKFAFGLDKSTDKDDVEDWRSISICSSARAARTISTKRLFTSMST